LNGIEDRVIRICGDAFDPCLLPAGVFDRAIIPTPYGMDSIFDLVAAKVRPGGMIHFYTFCNQHQADNRSEEFIRKGFDRILQRRCGNVAPGVSRWVYDLKKQVITGSATGE
jgi:tRNA (guanine37-N1)-methyltransferase